MCSSLTILQYYSDSIFFAGLPYLGVVPQYAAQQNVGGNADGLKEDFTLYSTRLTTHFTAHSTPFHDPDEDENVE